MMPFIVMNSEGWPGIDRAIALLKDGTSSLDVVEESVNLTEREELVRTVGFGGAPNALGVMQLDASCMRGDTLETGSVGALENFMHPISVARKVMETLPHVMLVGSGAGLLARELGFEETDILSPLAKARFELECPPAGPQRLVENFTSANPKGSHGTVISLVRDAHGCLAGGVSTSGWDYKYPGRVGDSAVIGAGLYVDNRYGAVACTHCGENAIRSSLARTVMLHMQKGAGPQEAVAEGLLGLRALMGGYQGQVVVFAVDKEGQLFVGKRLSEGEPVHALFWNGATPAAQRVDAIALE
jgi:L-asparaginase